LKTSLRPGSRLAVIGGGYIGLETAASALALGVAVTIIERESRVLARVAGPRLADFFESYHRGRGVRLELAATVTGFAGSGGALAAVGLADGREIPCDAALIAVGVAADDGLARQAGLACDDGVRVDHRARTDDPRIHAIGDCTRRPLPLYDRIARLESVPNALEQARQAAADLCGRPPPAPEVPWFWSDQYDLRLQIAGLPFETSETIQRGDVGAARFALFHLTADGLLQAVEAVNAAPDFMAGRQLVAARARVARERLADPGVSLADLAA
jgi:3-phenylpropionate/trans-cinnamate dioxygenase ferredoxin reductase subunit